MISWPVNCHFYEYQSCWIILNFRTLRFNICLVTKRLRAHVQVKINLCATMPQWSVTIEHGLCRIFFKSFPSTPWNIPLTRIVINTIGTRPKRNTKFVPVVNKIRAEKTQRTSPLAMLTF